MNALQRTLAVLNREQTDRTSVISPVSVATTESMAITGASFPEAHTDAKKSAALAAAGHEILGFDNVMPYFSIVLEAAALGAAVNWGTANSMPAVISHPYAEPGDFTMPGDFLKRPPVLALLDSIKILKERYKGEVAVCGKVIGPWTLSYHLYGTENFLMDVIAEPEKARGFLQAFSIIPIVFAAAQIEAGADIMTWADHATGDMVSAETYREFLLPVHKACVRELRVKAPPNVPVILHTCGYTLDRIPMFAETGFDAFHFDSKNDPDEALAAAGNKILLTGCINNTEILLNGTEDDVKRQAAGVMRAGIPMLSPECAVPCAVKNKNLRAIVETAAGCLG